MNIANNLINFWEGKTSLWKSYWIIGELINSLFILLMINIEIRVFKNSYILDNLPFLDFGNLNFITKIFILIWTIFITVGIWRSAESYKGRFLWIALTLIILSYRIFTLRIMLI